jgi:voltage-gated potassium channel Kch
MKNSDSGTDPNQIREIIRSAAIPIGLAVISISAGATGYVLYLPTIEAYSNASTVQIIGEGLFRSLGFLVLSMGAIESVETLPYILLTVGRLSGFLFFFYAAMAGIALVFQEQLRPVHIDLWSHLHFLPGQDDRGHVIICGIRDDGFDIAVDALEDGRNVVAIDQERNHRTGELERMGAVVLEGDATRERVLRDRARLHLATDVYITTQNSATNSTIVETIDQLIAANSWASELDITARVDDHRLRRTLHDDLRDTEGCYLRTYNVPEATARELLATHPVDEIQHTGQRIHIWLVGWTTLTKSLVNQLLHRMHYPDGINRQITVIPDEPSETQRDLITTFPGIDLDWWDDESMKEFIRDLFPDVNIKKIPRSDIELLSDKCGLYESLLQNDKLTIIADDTDVRSLRSLISVWEPKLDDLTREYNLNAELLYRTSDDVSKTSLEAAISTTLYTDFYNGCSTESVRGEQRDRIARRVALFYHLLYEEDPAEVFPASATLPDDLTGEIDTVVNWILSLSPDKRDQYATAVWRCLQEYKRESNRHAADHIAIKFRMAKLLNGEDTTPSQRTIRKLAESEHRRWCAEKILDGWEPLPSSKEERWGTESGQQELRDQRYHPSIRPVESLRSDMDGEWEKDVNLVKAVIEHPDIIFE